jgi:hypothetical protein
MTMLMSKMILIKFEKSAVVQRRGKSLRWSGKPIALPNRVSKSFLDP